MDCKWSVREFLTLMSSLFSERTVKTRDRIVCDLTYLLVSFRIAQNYVLRPLRCLFGSTSGIGS